MAAQWAYVASALWNRADGDPGAGNFDTGEASNGVGRNRLQTETEMP